MKEEIFNLSSYYYDIPDRLIAQVPAVPRDSSKLLVVDKEKGVVKERIFRDITAFLGRGDVLVLNNTKVIRARLTGVKDTGAKLDFLLLKKIKEGTWKALVKPAKRVRAGSSIDFGAGNFTAKITDKTEEGIAILEFCPRRFERTLQKAGKVPLPPYIKNEINDANLYQTVYAEKEGAVAAPTAGLHFTGGLIRELKKKGVKVVYVTLHCGLATFRPIKTSDIRNHKMEPEYIEVSSAVASDINYAKKNGKRVIGVGTTSIRSLESIAFFDGNGLAQIKPFFGETNLYITPGYKFKIIDSLITNFHTPYSTNLVLVSSFCGPSVIKNAYLYAKEHNFRFFSFGDAMLING